MTADAPPSPEQPARADGPTAPVPPSDADPATVTAGEGASAPVAAPRIDPREGARSAAHADGARGPARTHGLAARVADWSLRRRVGATFAALAVLMAVLMTGVLVSLVRFVTPANAVVNRWEPAAARSQDLLADLVNQETGIRGYALSRRDDALQPYRDYLAQQRRDEARLAGYLHGHPSAQRRLAALQQAAEEWRSRTADRLIALVRAGAPPEEVRLDDATDQARFGVIRDRSADLTKAVRAIGSKAREDRRIALDVLVVALAVGAVGILGVGVLLWRGLHWWVLAPVDRLAAETRAVAMRRPGARITPQGPREFAALAGDVETMRLAAEDMLARVENARGELARSNADLEQFAYVASHDLSEPLRKVANFCQLLERQYGPQLDDKAKQYIAFAVDGAKRMQTLISDLLALSRVGRTTSAFQSVDTQAALERAVANLERQIADSGAGVGHVDLPTVPGDQSLLTALFENLIGNAIKYRREEESPLIAVTAARDPDRHLWTFTVSDNGIGIDPQYAERIFAIFQRLHLRDEYGGTGVGLALCRKIVEYHGGKIWLDTRAPGPGATFRFTLPEGPLRDQ